MQFVAPKNFKRGRLIANKYTLFDIGIAGGAVFASVVMIVLYLTSLENVDGSNTAVDMIKLIILMIPAGLGLMFIVPSGIYHNIITFFTLMFMDQTSRKNYVWGGIYSHVEHSDSEKA
ncbi:MAG: hypothetical protein Q4D29_12370 [Lachnospiraceae bacterium]|nr:hypothetical protein [Lachnospiraceae bacterium]